MDNKFRQSTCFRSAKNPIIKIYRQSLLYIFLVNYVMTAHYYVIENVSLFCKLGKWRVCAEHEEMKFDLKTTTAIKDFEIRGDRWYSVFDDKQMKHLQVIGGDTLSDFRFRVM